MPPGLMRIATSRLATVTAAAAERRAAGSRDGLDRDEVFSVVSRLAPGLKVREGGFVRGAHEPAMFAIRDILKDLDLSLALYRQASEVSGSNIPLTGLARELFAEGHVKTPDLALSAIVNAYSTDAPKLRPNSRA